jgi:hypothetical protein
MRTFHLDRIVDESGVSGTGLVAEGVQFSSGKCVLAWRSGPKDAGRSICVYDDIRSIEAIHGHHGSTEVVFDDEGEVDFG